MRLTRLWRPFTDAPGRRDVHARFAGWLAEEAKWAEGRLVVGVDFALSLSETHLRQLGLLRQAIRGPAVLGRNLHERFVGPGGDFTAGAVKFRDKLGIDRSVLLGLTDGTDWTSAAQLEERVVEWHTAGFREFLFYDPPYARAGVPCAAPAVVEQVLHDSLPRLRACPRLMRR